MSADSHDVDTFHMSVVLFKGAKLGDSDKVQRYLKRGWRIKEVGPVQVLNKRLEGYLLLMRRARKNRRDPVEKHVSSPSDSDSDGLIGGRTPEAGAHDEAHGQPGCV
jgi:hypothetical protein